MHNKLFKTDAKQLASFVPRILANNFAPLNRALREEIIIPDIYKVELIGSGSLSVMAKPVSGEWIEDEFSNISMFGIDRIVSLLESHEVYDLGLEMEKILLKRMEWSLSPIQFQTEGYLIPLMIF